MEEMITEEQMELEDLRDHAEQVGKLTPREYARLKGVAPQLVYYHIRQGHVERERCQCGRVIIDVKLADQTFSKAAQASGRGPVVDTRPDEER